MQAGEPLNAINLNTINLAFLMLGFILHGTPARLMRAVQEATPAVWGVILQFPFYAGIAGIITGDAPQRTGREPVRPRLDADDVSAARRDVLGGARRLRAVGRLEVGDRSAVRHGGGAHS